MTTSDLVGDVLGVWGHPDDEAWLSAGLMMHALASGHRAICVTATKGEAGFPADDPRTAAERSAIRESELAQSLLILGVTDHRWLPYADGQCGRVPDEEGAAAVSALLAEYRPDTVVTFGPEGMTGHSDHIAVSRWTTLAVQQSPDPIQLLYATRTKAWQDEFFPGVDLGTIMMTPELEPEALEDSQVSLRFQCDDEQLARKVAALLAQESQIKALAEQMGADFFARFNRDEVFREPWPEDVDRFEVSRRLGLP